MEQDVSAPRWVFVTASAIGGALGVLPGVDSAAVGDLLGQAYGAMLGAFFGGVLGLGMEFQLWAMTRPDGNGWGPFSRRLPTWAALIAPLGLLAPI